MGHDLCTELGATGFYYHLVYPLGFPALSLFNANLPQIYLVSMCWEVSLSECDPAENAFMFAKWLINNLKLMICRDVNFLTKNLAHSECVLLKCQWIANSWKDPNITSLSSVALAMITLLLFKRMAMSHVKSPDMYLNLQIFECIYFLCSCTSVTFLKPTLSLIALTLDG